MNNHIRSSWILSLLSVSLFYRFLYNSYPYASTRYDRAYWRYWINSGNIKVAFGCKYWLQLEREYPNIYKYCC